MSVSVRAARDGDVASILALETIAFPREPWSQTLVTEGVAGRVPTATCLVAERDGVFVGHAILSVVQDVAELQRIAAVAGDRRTGIGTALLAAAVDRAVVGGAERLLLEVRSDNTGARAFYADRGFTRIAVRRAYYRDGGDAFVLERGLTGGTDA